MKDEEMAEEYASKQNLQNVNPSGIVRCKIAEGFLAGLKAGRPQWHDLREDKKDLPKNRKEVLLRVKLHDKWNREVTLKGYRDFGDCLGEYEEAWGYCDDVHNIKYDFVDGEEVIAWCEIPTFDKE